jgi:hypothetical protein
MGLLISGPQPAHLQANDSKSLQENPPKLGGWGAADLGHQESEINGKPFIEYASGHGPTLDSLYKIELEISLGEGGFATIVPASHSGQRCCAKVVSKDL